MLRCKKERRERAIGIAYEMNTLQFERVEQSDEIPGLDDGRVI